MGKTQSHIVSELIIPQRLQEYGLAMFDSIPTKSALKKALKKNEIEVDGVVASTATIITGGEIITYTPSEWNSSNKTLDLSLEVLFEDEYLAAILKPAGILVSGNSFRTIAKALPQNLRKSEQTDAVKPQPVHRLDYATTGILLVGKTSEAIRRLNKLFEDKEIEKTYYAVTIGQMDSEGTIKEAIDGKEAITVFKKITTLDSLRFKFLNLLKLNPKTGRRHQLRIHLANMGNPILGDKDYTPETMILKGKGMYLHAYSLTLVHPFTNKPLTLTAPVPERFTKIFSNNRKF